MGVFKWPLFFVFLWFKVQGFDGSCVVIPCSYNYPEPGKQITGRTGIWHTKTNDVIYHKDNNQIKQEFKGRTELVGDITQKNCSLKINPLRQSDRGPFYFRIELGGYNQYSYRNNEVSITFISAPQPTVSVKEEVVEGQTVSASCSVSHSCPSSPPEFTWTHSGEKRFQSQQLTDGQWKATSVLTFKATKADHNKRLSCTVRYKGGLMREQASNVLKVKCNVCALWSPVLPAWSILCFLTESYQAPRQRDMALIPLRLCTLNLDLLSSSSVWQTTRWAKSASHSL
uniref:Ig-like domain-containing protein n=1 Tax=Anabas testudineus TaxID=64144 RepID=A0A3Q1JHP0_ANATE